LSRCAQLDTQRLPPYLRIAEIEDVDQKAGKVQVKYGVRGGAKGGKGCAVILGKAARRAVWHYLIEPKVHQPALRGFMRSVFV